MRRFSIARSGPREQARLREEALRLLVESVKDYALYMLDAGGYVITWNAGAERIKGYADEEILGEHFSIFYDDADVRARKPERELDVALREGRCEDEGWRVRKDGSRFWANTVITPIYDDHETLLGFAKITRDMTERREAEEQARVAAIEQARAAALEDSAARLEFLAEASHVLSSTLDSEGIAQRASALLVPRLADWCTIYGAPEREGSPPRLLAVAHVDEAKAAWARALHQRHPPAAAAPQGPAQVIRSGAAELYTDVTDAQLQEAAGGDLGRLILYRELGICSGAAVPLRARGRVLGALAVVSTRPDKRYARQDMALLQDFADRAALAMENARLYEEAQRAASRSSSERRAMNLETFDLGALVEEVAERFHAVAVESRTELRVRTAPGVVGEWDRRRVELIVSNLVSNALKFGQGKPVDVEVSAEAGIARVVVRDQGIGVAKEDQERIFGQVERRGPASNSAGPGLGLWLAREFARARGGGIDLESEPGQGARFTVTLPLAGPGSTPHL